MYRHNKDVMNLGICKDFQTFHFMLILALTDLQESNDRRLAIKLFFFGLPIIVPQNLLCPVSLALTYGTLINVALKSSCITVSADVSQL